MTQATSTDPTYRVLPPDRIQRIYCLMLAEIGDILVTTPTLARLRRLYPNAQIKVILRAQLRRLLADNPHIDGIISYNQKNFLSKAAFLVKLFYSKPCDLWVDLHTPTFNTICSNAQIFKRNFLIQRCARPLYSAGYETDTQRRMHSHGTKTPSQMQLAQENIVTTTHRVLDQLAGKALSIEDSKFFHVSEADTQWAQLRLGNAQQPGRPTIGFFFGSKQPADVWPLSHCQAFLELLFKRYPQARIVLMGGPAEIEQARKLHATQKPEHHAQIINTVNASDFGQTGALMQRCDLVVSTDSGPLHILDALNIPLVALFSSKNHLKIWQPLSQSAIILNQSVPCGPCFSATCDKAEPCISMISPQSVLAAVHQLLHDPSITAAQTVG